MVGNLSKKANTSWNMASEIGGRGGKGAMVHGIRSLGNSTMDMVYVASGQADIMFEGALHNCVIFRFCVLSFGDYSRAKQPVVGNGFAFFFARFFLEFDSILTQ